MTEEEARERVLAIAGTAGIARIECYVDHLLAESRQQNLVSAATVPMIWERHILDSIQLAALARDSDRTWYDVGSGAGLPGLVVACLDRWELVLVEPRMRRVAFLQSCIDGIGLTGARVFRGNAQGLVDGHADVVSARAVGSMDAIFTMACGFADSSTRFLLPRGAGALDDVANARRDWHGMFHVEQSVTQARAGIVVADKVRPR